MRHWRGFTILELMITLVVLGILTALADPSFSKMIARNNLSAASNDLVVALLTARSEAVKRERYVTLCPSSNGNDCIADDTQREEGYIGFVDSNRDKERNVGEQEIIRHEVSSKLDIVVAGGIDAAVTYGPEGRAYLLDGANADFFTLTLDGQTKVVCLTLFGRPYIPDTPPNTPQSGADCT